MEEEKLTALVRVDGWGVGEGGDQMQKYILDTKIGLLPAIFVKLGLTCFGVWADCRQPKKH